LADGYLRAHHVLLDLSRDLAEQSRRITANFDGLFEACDRRPRSGPPPHLPHPHRPTLANTLSGSMAPRLEILIGYWQAPPSPGTAKLSVHPPLLAHIQAIAGAGLLPGRRSGERC
jgi:hypothetical protein